MEKDNLREKTIRGLMSMSSSSILIFVFQFALTLILARIFSPNEFGVISAVAIITSYTDIFWMMGVGPAIVQKKNLESDDVNTGFTISIVFGFLCFLLIYSSAPILSRLINIDNELIIQIIAISFVINSLGLIPISLLQRELNFNAIIRKDLLSILSCGVVAISLGILGMGVWALLIALLFKYIVGTAVVWHASRTKLSFRFNWINAKKLLHFGGGYTLSRFFSVTANQGDYFVITRTMGTFSLGLYNKAYQLIAIPAHLLGQVIDQVFFPMMAKIQDDNRKLSNIYIFTTAMVSMIYFPVGVLIYLYSFEIVIVLLGEQWLDAVGPLKVLALFMFFRIGYKISDPIFRAKGAVYNRAFIQMIYAMLVVLCSLIGVSYGLVGVTIGVGVALIINYIIITIFTRKIINFEIKDYIKSLVPSIIFSFISIPFLDKLKLFLENTMINLFYSNVIFIAIFITWFITFFCMMYYYFWSQYVRENLNKIMKKSLISIRNKA